MNSRHENQHHFILEQKEKSVRNFRTFESQHKMPVDMCEQRKFKPVCTSAQSVRVLVSRLKNVGSLAAHKAPNEDSGQTAADAHADLSIRWAHMSTCAFCWTGSFHLGPNGPRPEKTCLRGVANNTSADQPAHPRRLISTFVVSFLKSTISKLATGEI